LVLGGKKDTSGRHIIRGQIIFSKIAICRQQHQASKNFAQNIKRNPRLGLLSTLTCSQIRPN
jgi:hypothetical protein